jgi:Peptidase family M41
MQRRKLPWTPRPRRHPGRKALAYHEAGHAVVGCALGLEIEQVTIVPSEGSLGRCRYQGWDDEEAAGDVQTALIVLLAGTVAEEIAVGAPSRGADEPKARELALSQGHSEAEAADCIARARMLVAAFLEEHWPIVKALAAALRKERQLDGPRATAIIRRTFRKLGSHLPGRSAPLRGFVPGVPAEALPSMSAGG